MPTPGDPRPPLRLATPSVAVTPLPGGGATYRSDVPLGPVARCVGDWLVQWAEQAPDRVFLAERGADGAWRTLTYAGALAAVRGIGEALLARAGGEPVAALSDNGIGHALFQLGAMHVGVPVAPISPAYSLMSADHARLRGILAELAPNLVYAADAARFAQAIERAGLRADQVIDAAGLDGLAATPPTAAVDRAFAAVGPDTVAKILFTSGSTGVPKGAVNTQRMLCSNQQAIAQGWPFLADRPPITVDWLPWSHTFGGNHNFFLVLRNGGTLYVDAGRPAPALLGATVANLRQIAPTVYFNVPRGYELLVGQLEADDVLRDTFFSRLDALFYAAAALPLTTRARLIEVARRAGRADLFFTSAWGATETAPMATFVHAPTDTPGVIGVPAPGTEIRLAPSGDRLELRVRGPNVTPGYWRNGAVTPPALDEDGFLPTGDAARLDDPAHPERGFVFEGRLGENFKLTSGTWVRVGALRLAVVDAAAPLVQDAVIAGHGRDALGALLFLAPGVDRADPDVQRRLVAGIAAHNAAHPGTSERITRLAVFDAPPSLDAGETTDKGYLNQRRVLERRAADVERLFAEPPPPGVWVTR